MEPISVHLSIDDEKNSRSVSLPFMKPLSLSCAVLIGALSVVSCKKEGAQQGWAPGPPNVEFIHPVQEEITSWDEFTGRLEAVESVELRARVSGLLEKIHFEDGKTVKKGELLFTIDQEPFKAGLQAAKAKLAQVTAAANLARSNYERGKQLVERDAIAREEVEVRKGSLEESEANVTAAEAQVRIAELNLGYTEVRSPIDGRVADRFVTVGNLISGGSSQGTLLTTIVSLDPIYCRIDADDATVLGYMREKSGSEAVATANLSANLLVELGVEGEEGFPRTGTLDFANNQFDAGTGTLRLRAVFDNKDGLLSPGMFARVRLSGKGKHKATLVPEMAVLSRQDITYLLTLDEENIVQVKNVTLGHRHGKMRVIESSLPPETRVLVSGMMNARPGQPAVPTEATAPAPEGADSSSTAGNSAPDATPEKGAAATEKATDTDSKGEG